MGVDDPTSCVQHLKVTELGPTLNWRSGPLLIGPRRAEVDPSETFVGGSSERRVPVAQPPLMMIDLGHVFDRIGL